MIYLSQPITGFLLLTRQLFSGRVIFLIGLQFPADVFQIPQQRQALPVGCKLDNDTMKLQKIFLDLACLISVFSFSVSQKTNKQEIHFTAAIDKWDTTNNVNHLIIKARLTNNSSDTFSYVVMSCYYPFFYNTYPNILSQEGEDCNKNIPTVVRVPPYKNIETVMTLPITKDINQMRDSSFRIGIELISINNIINSLDIKQILSFTVKEHVQFLNDTSYKINCNFIAASKNVKIKRFDTSVNINFLWSNKINLKTTN
jgi:hypothetical protein